MPRKSKNTQLNDEGKNYTNPERSSGSISSGFCCFGFHIVKMKEGEKTNKYLDIARERRCKAVEHESDRCALIGPQKSWGKEFGKELEVRGKISTIRTTSLLRLAWIFEWVQGSFGDWLTLRLKWWTTSESWFDKVDIDNNAWNNKSTKRWMYKTSLTGIQALAWPNGEDD